VVYSIYLYDQQSTLLHQILEGILTTTNATREQMTQVREEFHARALLSVGNLAIMIRDAIANYRILGQANGLINVPPERCIRPPSLSQKYLATSIRDVPAPFPMADDGSAWRNWLAMKRVEMCTTSFLTAGEWVGYYSYYAYHAVDPNHIMRRQSTFDDAMTGIHFEVLEDGSLRADGHDGVGSFRFRGTTDGQGMVTGRKHYAAHWYYWDLSMTPFGLYGLWSSDGLNNRQLGGAIWLWKREWVS
jgi:hypothetical protein